MYPIVPWNDDKSIEVPKLTLSEAIIGTLANDAFERPFINSMLRHLFKGLHIRKRADIPELPDNPLAVPQSRYGFRNQLVVVSAAALTAVQLKLLELSGATVLLYTFKVEGMKEAQRYARMDIIILAPTGTFSVMVSQTDSLYATLPKRFTSPRIHVTFQSHSGGRCEPQGVPWEKSEKPKKKRSRATASKTRRGIEDTELL